MTRQETALAKVCLVGAVAALFGWGSLTVRLKNQEVRFQQQNFWANPSERRLGLLADRDQARTSPSPAGCDRRPEFRMLLESYS